MFFVSCRKSQPRVDQGITSSIPETDSISRNIIPWTSLPQDEIDALATARGESHDGPSAGVLTSLLNEMDGIEELSGVIVVAATNRPDVLVSCGWESLRCF